MYNPRFLSHTRTTILQNKKERGEKNTLYRKKRGETALAKRNY